MSTTSTTAQSLELQLPWDLADLLSNTPPTKEKVAVYLKAHATLAFLVKHKLHKSLKSVLKNRKQSELHRAYREFMEAKPFANAEQRASEQAALGLGEAAKLSVGTGNSGQQQQPGTSSCCASGASAGGASKVSKKKKKKKKTKKSKVVVRSAITGAGSNGAVGTKSAPCLNVKGFTDSYTRWGQVGTCVHVSHTYLYCNVEPACKYILSLFECSCMVPVCMYLTNVCICMLDLNANISLWLFVHGTCVHVSVLSCNVEPECKNVLFVSSIVH